MCNYMQISLYISPNVATTNHFSLLYNSNTEGWTRLDLHTQQTTKRSSRWGGRKDDNNRFVFQRRGSCALQLAGNDKYLHARPREGHATAALLSQTGILWRWSISPFHLLEAVSKLRDGGSSRDRSQLIEKACLFLMLQQSLNMFLQQTWKSVYFAVCGSHWCLY